MRKMKFRPGKQNQIFLTVNESQIETLNAMLDGGLHGKSIPQVALRILDEAFINFRRETPITKSK